MARYTGASCRLCRRQGEKLFLKGERCYTDKCAVSRRQYAPGQHGQSKKKLSEYGVQLREKQKAKRFYGVLESQFRKYFEMAAKTKGMTGENLLKILETRLDNVVYRLGFARSRSEARQLVRHGHFNVNARKVDIPSYVMRPNDLIEVREGSKEDEVFKEVLDATGSKVVPAWLSADHENLKGTVLAMPAREDVDVPVQEHMIVELYSK
ncbi:MAG TPA: 30S ribosomal protein S4 [Actinobacteria bacterium]|nr:30S ribosomal protein S4 [Actinomycetota bacterium]